VQNGAHRLLRSRLQLGRAGQLGTEPGAVVRYTDTRTIELDGNTRRGNSSAERIPLVTRGDVVLGWAFGRAEQQIRACARTC
jgi:hypothetical protein